MSARSSIIALVLAAATLHAPQARSQTQELESIEIGLSTDSIAITSDFSGADLTIFGALDNADPQLAREHRYDVVVVLEGPAQPVVVRKKSRVLGVWVNTDSKAYDGVPISYSVATTRQPQDIAEPAAYRQLSLGVDYLHVRALDDSTDAKTLAEFTAALRQQKRATGLYSERVGGVQFLTQSLFRATVTLAPSVPVGTHRARAFLFRNGMFLKETSAQLVIVKSGMEQAIYQASKDDGFLYGLFAVALAMLTGWLGRIVFRRD